MHGCQSSFSPDHVLRSPFVSIVTDEDRRIENKGLNPARRRELLEGRRYETVVGSVTQGFRIDWESIVIQPIRNSAVDGSLEAGEPKAHQQIS